ncbi:6331_t:CDS:2 [Paraglomus occultum]|uniref:6331_t:CDS:1 n=1 Tax=Paraglomus occultum TaxID=144539 RepID=A0A9N9A2A6_9GLOM|nr:6331_t:CDS:2 [Paraglomus occultum]
MEFFEGLSKDFNSLLKESDDYDVIIYADKDSNVQKFHAHTVILRARSRYFRRALSRDWAKKENGVFVFKKPNITAQVFEVVLKYIYGGTADLQEQSGNVILSLLTASDELNLGELIKYTQEHLIHQKLSWLQENLVQVLHTVSCLEDCKTLREFCLEMICQDPRFLFRSENFCTLDESVLVLLLQRDDLQIDEIEVWENVIKWGLAQDPPLDSDLSRWTDDDFKTMQSRLSRCISLIRYFQISPADFCDRVRPYAKILPEDLHEDILRFHLKSSQQVRSVILPARIQGIDSNIIKPRHAALIACWIDRKEGNSSTCERIRYEFKLLLRGSRDGFTAAAFHNRCDNQVPTLILMKIQNTGEIIGGYNPTSWRRTSMNSDSGYFQSTPWGHHQRKSALSFARYSQYELGPFQTTSESFIFSLGDGKKVEDFVLSRITRENMCSAVYSSPRLGPCFGRGDLKMTDHFNAPGKCSCEWRDYEREITDSEVFAVEEYEVFHITDRGSLSSSVLSDESHELSEDKTPIMTSSNHTLASTSSAQPSVPSMQNRTPDFTTYHTGW